MECLETNINAFRDQIFTMKFFNTETSSDMYQNILHINLYAWSLNIIKVNM